MLDDEEDVAPEPWGVDGVALFFEGAGDGFGDVGGVGGEGDGSEGHFGVDEAGFDGEDVDAAVVEAVA